MDGIFPALLRDILLVIFILLLFPVWLNSATMVVYLLVLRNIGVYRRFDAKMVVVQLVKTAAINVCIYQALLAYVPRVWFNYFFILANLIIANHLIGHKSLRLLDNNHLNHVVNAVCCFFFIIYTVYFLNWMEVPTQLLRRGSLPATTILSLATITADIFTFHGPDVGTDDAASGAASATTINCDSLKLLDIDVRAAPARHARLVVWHNFDTLVMSPFRLPKHWVQPVWVIVTALKALYADATVFLDPGAAIIDDVLLVSLLELATLPPPVDNSRFALAKINDNEVVVQFSLAFTVHALRINGIPWHYYLVVGHFLVVLGLTPHFQYQIDIDCGDAHALLAVTTTTAATATPSDPVADSPLQLATLENLVELTHQMLLQHRANYKKMKRDHQKRLAELRHHLDTVRAKIAKTLATSNELRMADRFETVQYHISRLEHENAELTAEEKQLIASREAVLAGHAADEQKLKRQIRLVEQQTREREARLAAQRAGVAKLRQEADSLKQRHRKLAAEADAKHDEVKLAMAELRSAKRDGHARLAKRSRRIHDKYDVILPKVRRLTEALHQECNRVLQS